MKNVKYAWSIQSILILPVTLTGFFLLLVISDKMFFSEDIYNHPLGIMLFFLSLIFLYLNISLLKRSFIKANFTSKEIKLYGILPILMCSIDFNSKTKITITTTNDTIEQGLNIEVRDSLENLFQLFATLFLRFIRPGSSLNSYIDYVNLIVISKNIKRKYTLPACDYWNKHFYSELINSLKLSQCGLEVEDDILQRLDVTKPYWPGVLKAAFPLILIIVVIVSFLGLDVS